MVSLTTDDWRPRASIRARLLGTIVALMTGGLVVAGATGYGLERANLERGAAEQFSRDAEVFAALATRSVDPDTGEPFTTASALLRTAIQQQALGPAEGALGLVGDRIEWTAPASATVRLEDDARFVGAALGLAAEPSTSQGRTRTDVHDLIYLVAPVRFEATGETGALVLATDVALLTRQLDNTYRLYAAVAAFVVAVAAVVAWAVMGRLLAPIARLRVAAETIGEHDLTSRIPVRGRDDLSTLTVTINRMLDRIEALVEGQRQLVDDVGHELRTPLTIIRGHIELLDPTDVDDVRATRQLALEEVDRMERLTDDLVLLATSERSDFVVLARTDLAQLTNDTLELVRRLAHRPWHLDAIAEGGAWLDPQRIRQAWLQLVDNALKYSPGDSPIALGSEVRGDEAWLWVRDGGPGIDPAERERLVHRSVRGEAALRSGRRGHGLGLSIVTKIVAAHGGRLAIATAPGGGALVSIVLPLAPVGEGAEP